MLGLQVRGKVYSRRPARSTEPAARGSTGGSRLWTLASRRTGSNEHLLRAMLEACAEACRLCGSECAAHAAQHEHCAICAEACRRCEQACVAAAGTITPARRQ